MRNPDPIPRSPYRTSARELPNDEPHRADFSVAALVIALSWAIFLERVLAAIRDHASLAPEAAALAVLVVVTPAVLCAAKSGQDS